MFTNFVTFLFCYAFAFVIHSASAEKLPDLIRKTEYGSVEGTVLKSAVNSSVEFLSFTSIPFAQPPVGSLRFQSPKAPQPWHGVRNATVKSNICVQFQALTKTVVGDEDCLYLNVYVPITNHNDSKLLPVLVWIHGGGFTSGSAYSVYGPDYFMEKPVVVVTFNYRLNVFGFFSTFDQYARGNAGLKDQALALKWVQNNIDNFNGDPKCVTIFGASAGGASVQYHMVSPLSKGLFHRAIVQSGSVLNRWALSRDPKGSALLFSKHLAINETDTKAIVEKLQSIDYQNIFHGQESLNKFMCSTLFYGIPFLPIIESPSNEAFINESSYLLLESGQFEKVPTIMGQVTQEGYTCLSSIDSDIKQFVNDPELLISSSLNLPRNSSKEDQVLQDIWKEYSLRKLTVNDTKTFTNFMSDELFVRGLQKALSFIYQRNNQVYWYVFRYTRDNEEGNVGHYMDVKYLWYNPATYSNFTEDNVAIKRMVTLWTNFALHGNPTPTPEEVLQNVLWYPVSNVKDGRFEFLSIDRDLQFVKPEKNLRFTFWENVFKLYGSSPFVTY